MRKFLKILGIVIASILLLLGGVMLALQIPAVQQKILEHVIRKTDGVFDGEFSVGSIQLLPFNTLIVKDVLILDKSPYIDPYDPDPHPRDTFAYVGYASVRLSLKSLLGGEGVDIRKAVVRNAEFNLCVQPDFEVEARGRGITNLQQIFRLKIPEKKKPEKGKIFEIKNVEVENFIFRLINYRQRELQRRARKGRPGKTGINWNDLELITDIKGRNLGMVGRVMHGTADHVEIYEKSGCFIDHVEGRTEVGHGKSLFYDLRIRDAYSDIDVPSMQFLYGDQEHFRDFVNGVRIVADINPSKVDLGRTIAYFADVLFDNPIVLDVQKGGVDGPVSDLGIKDIRFKDLSSGVSGTLDGKITGLPGKNFNLGFNLDRFSFTTASLGSFIRSWAPGLRLDLSKFAPRETFQLTAKGHGPLNRLIIDGTLLSSAGNARFNDLILENLTDKTKPVTIGGGLSSERLNIGRIIGNDKLGELTMTSSLDATLGKNPVVTLDSLSVRKLHAFGYDYSNIRAQGVYKGNSFDGRIVSHDPNLDLMAQGLFSISEGSGNTSYEGYVNLGYADLGALGFDKNGKMRIALNSDINFIRTKEGDLVGDISVSDINLANERGTFSIGDLTVQSHFNDEVNRMKFDSRFFNGTYVSTRPIDAFVKQLVNVTARREMPVLFTKKSPGDFPADYALAFRFHDMGKLLEFALPSAYIEDDSRLDLHLDEDGNLEAKVRSGRLAIGDKFIKDVTLDIDNRDNSLNGTLRSSELRIGGIRLGGANANIYADDNTVGADIRYDNKTEKENKGDLSLAAQLRRNAAQQLECSAHVLPSNIFYDDDLWRISSDEILIRGNDISVNRFLGASSDQSLLVDGGYSPTRTDTLSVRLERFDISLLDGIVKGGYTFQGRVTGNAFVTSPAKGMPGLLASLQCEEAAVAGYPLGTLDLGSRWDAGGKRFLVDVTNHLDGKSGIDAHGWITPKGELDISADLDQFNLGVAKPILASVFSTFDGGLTGKVRASGSAKQLRLQSENARLDNAHLGLDYTKCVYTVNGPVDITEKGIEFSGVDITDSLKGTGKVTGGVYFNTLKNITLGVHMAVRNMLVLDTHEGDDPTYYGHIVADGTVDVTGPTSKINIGINARTSGPGDIHIPLGNASGEKRTFLTYTQAEEAETTDPYELMMKKREKKAAGKSELDVGIRVLATPELTTYIEVNKATGNILSATGNGTIDLTYTSRNNYFGIGGQYILNSGHYMFNALNIINKEFQVREGGSIRFNGDVKETDLDIDAVYTTKASLQPLLGETDAVESRRTVECGIHISDKLRNPQIGLSIDIPDLDSGTQAQVNSALSSEDKVQRQFIYLLISGSFMPSDFSGIANNTSNLLYSNVTNIMTNQLNNIFARLNIPLDLGLNYKSSEAGNNLFDVAVSTQLFKNRVVINGSIGNREQASRSATNVVGDIEVEVKLDRQGAVRLKAFSHSADQYTNYLDNSQRNGIGISYQREFNSFRQFFKTLFRSRRKRQEDFLLENQNVRSKTLEIGRDGNVVGNEKRKNRKKDDQR